MTALLVTCGALARDVVEMRDRRGWDARVLALPAQLHNRPERIPDALRRRLAAMPEPYEQIVVVYGDCGTGGMLDRTLEEMGIQRIAGPHCYEQYAGSEFGRMMAEEAGTFFLTDFLARAFRKLVFEGLGLDRLPALREDYFGAYRRMVYLQQRADPDLLRAAQEAARLLALPLEVRRTGTATLEARISERLQGAGRRPRPIRASTG